jgi:hypothetical protein
VTENKSLKRRVRTRMTKTGERYTAARRQLLEKAPARPTGGPTAPEKPATSEPNEPLHGPTDRTWSQWVAVLDEWGARDKTHTEIARWLYRDLGVDGWWSQDITVRYERHIGRRVVGQRGSTFSATGTKTINVAADVARAAWVDARQRAKWLPGVELRQRPNRAPIVARFDVKDGEGRVVVSFDPRGAGKVSVAIEHEKLPNARAAARWTALWRERLKVLKEQLEAGRGPVRRR